MIRVWVMVVLAWAGAGVALAQPYSLGSNDNTNAFDAPIPGFVGPGGEGDVAVFDYDDIKEEWFRAWGDAIDEQNVVNPLFLAWASTVVAYEPAPGVDAFFSDSGEALGAVTGDQYWSVVALGDLDASQIAAGEALGSLTLRFDEPIRDLAGADFAVYENAFTAETEEGGAIVGQSLAELAYIEVSSDGTHFARFPSVSLTPTSVGEYGSIDPTEVYNLAGKHGNSYGISWGTPFDLAELADDPLVLAGTLDLDAVTHVRLVDVPGSGDFLDSLGNPIFDAWPTYGPGGADIEAVGAISQALTYDEWDAGRGLAQGDSSDGDSWTHWEEYAYRLDPAVPDAGNIAVLEQDAEGFWLVFPRDQRIADVVYVVEVQVGGMLSVNWSEIARIGPLDAETLLTTEAESIEYRSVAAQASVGVLQEVRVKVAWPEGASGKFYRVKLEAVE